MTEHPEDGQRRKVISLLEAAEKLALDLGEGTLAYLIERARDEAYAGIVSPDGTAPLEPR